MFSSNFLFVRALVKLVILSEVIFLKKKKEKKRKERMGVLRQDQAGMFLKILGWVFSGDTFFATWAYCRREAKHYYTSCFHQPATRVHDTLEFLHDLKQSFSKYFQNFSVVYIYAMCSWHTPHLFEDNCTQKNIVAVNYDHGFFLFVFLYCKVTNFRTVLNFVLSYFWKK